jgi:hypothetical protein
MKWFFDGFNRTGTATTYFLHLLGIIPFFRDIPIEILGIRSLLIKGNDICFGIFSRLITDF